MQYPKDIITIFKPSQFYKYYDFSNGIFLSFYIIYFSGIVPFVVSKIRPKLLFVTSMSISMVAVAAIGKKYCLKKYNLFALNNLRPD